LGAAFGVAKQSLKPNKTFYQTSAKPKVSIASVQEKIMISEYQINN